MNTGWLCPRCERVNAPTASQCSCVVATASVGKVGVKPSVTIETPPDPPGTVRIIGDGTAGLMSAIACPTAQQRRDFTCCAGNQFGGVIYSGPMHIVACAPNPGWMTVDVGGGVSS